MERGREKRDDEGSSEVGEGGEECGGVTPGCREGGREGTGERGGTKGREAGTSRKDGSTDRGGRDWGREEREGWSLREGERVRRN